MRKPKKQKKLYQLVNFGEVGGLDRECILLGAYARSNDYIESQTGFTRGQINYRLKLAGIQRMRIRDGKGAFADFILNTTRGAMEDRVLAHLRKHL